MLTLGIHDGHTATACLWENGKVIACISEERLNRKKGWKGFPELSIEKCFEITGKSKESLDGVGFCSVLPQSGEQSYFSPPTYKKMFSYAAQILPKTILQNKRNVRFIHRLAPFLFRKRKQYLYDQLQKLNIRTDHVKIYDHHLLHAATACYTNWYRKDRHLVITLDGSGDAICATINKFENGKLEKISEIFNYNSICELYTRVTQHLGMKPMSHEYKVMGMAPYAPEDITQSTLELFRSYFKVSSNDPLQFLNTSGLWKWKYNKAFTKVLHEKRFDSICGAVQKIFEEVVLEWVQNAIRETGIGNVVLSGGGFMNVKLNYLIAELPEVETLFIFPSCGDESNPVGAAMMSALDLGYSAKDITPLHNVYWGPSFSEEEIQAAIDKNFTGKEFSVERYDEADPVVAQELAAGKIVGRFTGRMEWGARSLGNRSILANPQQQKIIHKINRAIKMRDFWMPFAPAILQEYRDKYLQLRKDYHCPFMTIAANTHPIAHEQIPATLHPFDLSTRAQILDPESHTTFYPLVKEFEKITGIGGILNTSFNLHGDPIVCTPEDAAYTFVQSDLDVLQLENFVIRKVS